MPITNTCTTCFKSFNTTSALRSHCGAKEHPFCVCEPCERSFGSEKALADHINSPCHRVDSEDSEESSEDEEEETYCDGCNRDLLNSAALFRHRRDSPKHNWCSACAKDFSSAYALDQHMNSPRHQVEDDSEEYIISESESEEEDEDAHCDECDRHFVNSAALDQHRSKSSKHNWCSACSKDFSSEKALDQHLNSPRHQVEEESEDDTSSEEEEETRCDECDRGFVDLVALNQHRVDSSQHNWCSACSKDFSSQNALNQHMNSPRHQVEDYEDCEETPSSDPESEDEEEETFCHGCNRDFVDSVALYRHRNYSPKHHWCFACSRDFSSEDALDKHVNSLAHRDRIYKCPFCQSMFKSPSGIALHIESGCHNLTRHHVTAAVRSWKIAPDIAIKRITGRQTSSAPNTIETFIATDASFDGRAYVCFLCSKRFRSLVGLNSHLNSAAHDDDEFRCPKCRVEFKLISGFVQHLESRSCGFVKEVEDYSNDLADNFSRLLKL